jgi:hypothetical protein
LWNVKVAVGSAVVAMTVVRRTEASTTIRRGLAGSFDAGIFEGSGVLVDTRNKGKGVSPIEIDSSDFACGTGRTTGGHPRRR